MEGKSRWVICLLLILGMAAPAWGATKLPEGTVIIARTTEKIDVHEAESGDRYHAVIDENVVVDGQTVIPEGSEAEVRLYKSDEEDDALGLRLYSITVHKRYTRTASEFAQVAPEKGERHTGRNTALGAAIGGVIGAIAGGKKGALIGAGLGAGSGLILSKAKGGHSEVPAETRLSFKLSKSIRVK
ncbi:MAG: hypothetical protein P8020_06210 [Acidobacteriota bacterium]|jgi:hypothetical protein